MTNLSKETIKNEKEMVIVTMTNLLEKVSEMKVVELRQACKDLGVKGYSKLRKPELIDLLEGEITLIIDRSTKTTEEAKKIIERNKEELKELNKAKNHLKVTIDDAAKKAVENINKGKAKVEEFRNAIENGAIEGGTWINDLIAKRSPYTLKMVRVIKREWTESFAENWFKQSVGSNRMSRAMDQVTEYSQSKRVLKLKNVGKEFEVNVNIPYIELEGDPVLYLDFVEKPSEMNKDEAHEAAYQQCCREISGTLMHNDIEYEYAMSSASQLRTCSGIAIRTDFTVPKRIIGRINRNLPDAKEYIEFLKSLRGMEALLEIITYGAYSHEFTNRFEEFKRGEKLIPNLSSLAKFMARAGLGLTSSRPFGRNWNVKHIGCVRFEWGEYLEEMFRSITFKSNGQDKRLYSDKEIEILKMKWKSEKLDGQNVARASRIVKELKKYGIRMTREEVCGMLVQFRWGGVKGTALVMDDDVLDACLDREGNPVYKGFDLIVEDSSWKHGVSEFFLKSPGISPEFELVNHSKPRFTSMMNYQFINALDGVISDPSIAINNMKQLIDEHFEGIRNMLTDPEVAKAKLGLTDTPNKMDELDVDGYAMSQRSKITKALAACDFVTSDRWWGTKAVELFSKSKERAEYGKFEVEGANRYMISDPIAMLRTDLMDDEGNIIITNPSQVALGNMETVYWADKNQEAVMFRSPCVHPGEPQRVWITNEIVETIETAYGSIPVRKIYGSMRDIVIVNGFSNILEAMGGADTDGDTCLIVTDPRIIMLRNPRRKTLVVTISSDTKKEEITPDSIKQCMIDSLRNNGIGLITNYATTFRDIASHIINGGKLTYTMEKELGRLKKEARNNLEFSDEDLSVKAIAEMELKSIKSVYGACEAALCELRRLQEMAINTAKSGIWVEFGSEEPDVNSRQHLMIKIRSKWHKPDAKLSFDSNSLMNVISKYTKERWLELKKFVVENSSALLIGDKAEIPNWDKLFKRVYKIKAEYGSFVHELKGKDMSKEQFKQVFGEFTDMMHLKLTSIAMVYGVDAVVYAAYDASNQDEDKGVSFVWNCFFDELIHVLKYAQSGDDTFRLAKIFVDENYIYEALKSGIVTIKEGEAIVVDGEYSVVIGYCNLPDGDYNMVVIDGTPYVKVRVKRNTVKKMTATLNGSKLPIIGFKYNNIDRNGVMELLASNKGQMVVRTAAENIKTKDGTLKPRAVCYVRYKTKEEEANPSLRWRRIGVIPFDDKIVMKTLLNKYIKVNFLPSDVAKDSDSRITLEVREVLGVAK